MERKMNIQTKEKRAVIQIEKGHRNRKMKDRWKEK
jgi:hypothetical protein